MFTLPTPVRFVSQRGFLKCRLHSIKKRTYFQSNISLPSAASHVGCRFFGSTTPIAKSNSFRSVSISMLVTVSVASILSLPWYIHAHCSDDKQRAKQDASMLGVIGGSSFLKSECLSGEKYETICVDTDCGSVNLLARKDSKMFFVQRHACDPDRSYSPPHLVNYHAIILALKQLGVKQIIAFGSVGSLSAELLPGTLVIPDDYFTPIKPIHFYDDARGHIVPAFDMNLRKTVMDLLKLHITSKKTDDVSYPTALVDSGVYAQTDGPRFESRAEIRFLASVADVVGMTCANEATLCQELEIPYAVICMVDNMANGVIPDELSLKLFRQKCKQNEKAMENVLSLIIENFAPVFSKDQ